MTTADYELDGKVIQHPAPQPKPAVQSLTVSLERKVWTQDPNGTYSVAVGLTAERDPDFPTAPQLDQLHRLLRARLDDFLDSVQVPNPPPNGGR